MNKIILKKVPNLNFKNLKIIYKLNFVFLSYLAHAYIMNKRKYNKLQIEKKDEENKKIKNENI